MGPGHTIVLCDLSLPLPRLLAIALHEAAHLLPLKSPCLRSRIEPSRGQVESEKSRALVAIQDEVKAKSKGCRFLVSTPRPQLHPPHGSLDLACCGTRLVRRLDARLLSLAHVRDGRTVGVCGRTQERAVTIGPLHICGNRRTPEPAAFGELFIESTGNFMRKQHADSNRRPPKTDPPNQAERLERRLSQKKTLGKPTTANQKSGSTDDRIQIVECTNRGSRRRPSSRMCKGRPSEH